MPQAIAEIPKTNIDSAAGMTVTEAARRLSVSESHFWRMIKDGEVRAIKFGRRTVVPLSEILRVLNGGAP